MMMVLQQNVMDLRDVWESTSFALDRRQANPDCVDQEQLSLRERPTGPEWHLSFVPRPSIPKVSRVAILRAGGSNGDKEMQSAFYAAGFEVH